MTDLSSKPRAIHWAWVILGTCFVNLFINYAARLGYAVILPEMIRDMGLGRADAGSIYNAYLFTYIAVTPFTGYLTDCFGARRVVTCCALILGLGAILMGTAGSLWAGCLSYAVVGLGATGMWTPVITVVQRWFAVHRRGFALGILSTGYGLGLAVMGAGFPWIVQHYSWRFAWYFLGGSALVMVGVNGGLLRSSPESEGVLPWGQGNVTGNTDAGEKAVDETISIAWYLKTRAFWFIGMSYFAVSYALYGITTFMVDYAKTELQLPLEQASRLATVHGICQVVGVLTVLPLSDYLGRKRAIVLSNAMITLSLAGIAVKGESWEILVPLIGLLAVFYGATFPIYGACAGDYFPRRVMGTIIGAWTPFYGLGAIATHWVTGMLRDLTGVYRPAFIIDIVMAGLAVLLISRVRR